MVRSLEDMGAKGKRKYVAKLPAMDEHYGAAIPRAKSHYGQLPFGSTIKGNYNTAMDSYALDNYRGAMTPDKADKWYDNWISKMRA